MPSHRNNIFLRAVDHLHQGAVGEIPNVQLVFPGVSQRTAEILTVSAEVPIHPADAVDGVFIPAKALQKDSAGKDVAYSCVASSLASALLSAMICRLRSRWSSTWVRAHFV